MTYAPGVVVRRKDNWIAVQPLPWYLRYLDDRWVVETAFDGRVIDDLWVPNMSGARMDFERAVRRVKVKEKEKR